MGNREAENGLASRKGLDLGQQLPEYTKTTDEREPISWNDVSNEVKL